MATRYRYSTCLSFGQDGEPGYTEIDVTVSYRVLWGRPETPPAYSHGGLPADPDEIDDIKLISVDGVGGPFDQHDEAAILQAIAQNHAEAMIMEARESEVASEDDYREREWEDRRAGL